MVADCLFCSCQIARQCFFAASKGFRALSSLSTKPFRYVLLKRRGCPLAETGCLQLAPPLASFLLALHYFCMAWACENEELKQHYELGKRLGVPILPIECHRFAPVLQKYSQSNGMAHPRNPHPQHKEKAPPKRGRCESLLLFFWRVIRWFLVWHDGLNAIRQYSDERDCDERTGQHRALIQGVSHDGATKAATMSNADTIEHGS